MIGAIADALGIAVEIDTVWKSFSAAGAVDMIGRAVFVEGARLMGWFAGPLGVWGVSALGHLTIAICNNQGQRLSAAAAGRAVSEDAQDSFDWKEVKQRARART